MAKYSKKLAQSFCEILAQTGGIEMTCEAIGIDHSTYYRWRSRYPQFKDMVEEAKLKYHSPAKFLRLRKLAEDRLEEILKNGWIETSTITETKRDRDGEIVSETTKELVTRKPPPNWVLARFIAPRQPELMQLANLMDEGLLPVRYVEFVQSKLGGMYQELKELGIEVSPQLSENISDREGD